MQFISFRKINSNVKSMSENFLTSDDQFHFNCELKTKRTAFYGMYIIIRTFIRNVQ